jgi:chromosome segregation ATPase
MSAHLSLRGVRAFDRGVEKARRDCQQAQAIAAETQAEFKQYKVRAHTLLNKKKEEHTKCTADGDGEGGGGLAEAAAHKAEIATLKAKAIALEAELEEARAAIDDAEADLEQLAGKLEAAQAEGAATKTAFETQLARLKETNELAGQEHVRSVRQLKLDHSMLVRSQKEEMETLVAETETKLKLRKGEVETLQKRLADAEVAAVKAATEARANATAAAGGGNSSGGGGGGGGGGNGLAVPGRGSAAVADWAQGLTATPDTRVSAGGGDMRGDLSGGHAQVGLEGLLSGTGSQSSNGGTFPKHVGPEALDNAQRQIAHLSELLADSENSVARLEEQSKILKLEIRRQEASVERANGTNLEYLKNVSLKFISTEAEREQLIPVLGTLLKFTKEELANATKQYRLGVARVLQNATAGGTSWWG